MSAEDQLSLADKAISHVLCRIEKSPEVGWYMGHGTESFYRLCEAYAAMHGGTAEAAREMFGPKEARDPRRDLEKRIDELEEKLESRALATGCGIEDIPTYGPQDLTAEQFRERVELLLLTKSHTPAAFVREIAELFDVTDVPLHLLVRSA